MKELSKVVPQAGATPISSPKKNFLDEINYLRGFTIFLILWCHMRGWVGAFSKADWNTSWWIIEKVRATYVDCGTSSHFVFISGVLFYQVFYKRGFDYRRFVKSKLLKVMTPWFIIATIFTAFRLYSGHGSFFDSNFMYYGGYCYASFWYMPFIMLIFLCSCFFLKFIESSLKAQLVILVISTIFAMCLGRHNTNPFLSVLFWSCFYFFGILVGIYYDKLLALDTNTKLCIVAATVLYMATLASVDPAYWLPSVGTYDFKFADKLAWIVPAKMLLSLSLLYFFYWFKDAGWRWLKGLLNLFAKYSFSIFFLHQFVLLNFERHGHRAFFAHFNFYGLQLICFLLAIAVCFLCILVAAPIKRLAGKYSRMIIGS